MSTKDQTRSFLGVLRKRQPAQSPVGINRDYWIVGKYTVEQRPVIFKYLDPLPGLSVRSAYPSLVVVSWSYDGSDRNGMPPDHVNKRMIELEDALDLIEEAGVAMMVYSKTGDDLKEFAMYARSQKLFMEHLNTVSAAHPIYPIQVNLYQDAEWRDYSAFRESVSVE